MIRLHILDRRNWTFAGSDRGGERAAALYTLLQTAKLNDVDPQTWLTNVLSRIADHPINRCIDPADSAQIRPPNRMPQRVFLCQGPDAE
jgi:IS66 C-terminal element